MKITPLLLAGALALTSGNLWAASGRQDSIDRLQMSSDVLRSIMSTPDKGIPDEVVKDAKCIVVVPHLVKAALWLAGSMAAASRRAALLKAGALRHSYPWAAEAGIADWRRRRRFGHGRYE